MTFEDNLPSWRALAREHFDDWKAERERRIKAEKEREKARAGARLAFDRCREWEVEHQKLADELYRIRAAESRPLTPDAITDEMVERAADRFRELDSDHEISEMDLIRGTIIAALTEPPARPEGAEKVEAVLHQYWSGDIDGDDLADRIAEEMNR